MKQAGRSEPKAGKSDFIKKVAPAVGPTVEEGTQVDRPTSKEANTDSVWGSSGLPDAPGSWERWVGGDAPTAQEEHGNQGPGAVETEGPSGDHSELVVEAFGHAVCELGFDVGENTLLVLANRPGGFDKGCELGAGGPCEPAVDGGLCIRGGGFVENVGEGLFEEVGPVERGVVFLDGREFVPVLGAEVPWAFEQGETGLLDSGSGIWVVEFFESADHFSSHVIYGVADESLDMETVEDDLGVRRIILDGVDVPGGHIDSDDFEVCGAFFSDFFEEGVECFLAFSFFGPDDALCVVIDDDGDVSVSFSVAEFVHTDALDVAETPWVEFVFDYALDDVAYGGPGDAEHPGDLGFVGDLSEVGGHLLERFGETAVASGPWHLFDFDSACMAFHTSGSVFEDDPDGSKVEVDPLPRLPLVVAGCDLPALGTARQTPGRFHCGYEAEIFKTNAGYEKTGNSNKNFGKLGDAHDFLPVSRCWRTPRNGKTVRISIFGSYFNE